MIPNAHSIVHEIMRGTITRDDAAAMIEELCALARKQAFECERICPHCGIRDDGPKPDLADPPF